MWGVKTSKPKRVMWGSVRVVSGLGVATKGYLGFRAEGC